MKQTFPPRLHVIFARQASTAIVIRRGPSDWTSTFAWDRATDTVRSGQWLHGHIYPRRCDLSPDGKRFIYFAMNARWRSESKGAWTAISRTPYLKAIGFWPKGDCWHGGGLFVTDKVFWLNGEHSSDGVRLPPGLTRKKEPPFRWYWGGECTGVYYPHLLREGWKMIAQDTLDPDADRHTFTRFERALPGGWTMIKTAHETIDHPVGKACYYDEHLLRRDSPRLEIDGKDWEWCEWDAARNRLTWATAGCLYCGQLVESGLIDERLVHDFNGYEFQAVVAPY